MLKGFENKVVSFENDKNEEEIMSEKKSNSLLAKFTSFFEDEID